MLSPTTIEKGFTLASKESTAGRNRPTQVLVAGCCFIAVMCAIQVWRNNRSTLLNCGETVTAVFETSPTTLPKATMLPKATTLPHHDDVVFMPHELKPKPQPKLDAPVARKFSSEISFAELDSPVLVAPPLDVANVSAGRSESAADVASKQAALKTIASTETQPNLSAIEQFAATTIRTPVDMTHLIDSPQLADIDFDTDVNEQMAELQTLDPAPPVAKQVVQARLTDLASSGKGTQPWPNEWELERDQLQGREQRFLDEMIEDFEHKVLESESQLKSRPIYQPEIDPSAEPVVPMDEPAERPAELHQKPEPIRETKEPSQPKPSQPEPQQSEPQPLKKPVDPKRIAAKSGWPKPNALFRSLDKLSPVYGVEDWANQVRDQLSRLATIQDISDPAATDVFKHLRSFVDQAAPISLQLTSRSQQVAVRQSAYALSRRLDVWEAAHLASQPHHVALPHEVYHSVEPERMRQRIEDARQGLTRFQNSESWAAYLLLDELEQAAAGHGPFAGAARAELAEIALDRLTDPNLSNKEMAFLKSLGLEALGQELRLWATHPVSQTDMLAALERFELEPTNPIKADRLATYRKDLHWSAVPSQNNVAAALDTHYRNANVRVSINETMINRLVPAVQDLRLPVRDNILGAQVKGQSRSRTKVFVRLLPDRSRLRFMFETRGEMAAQTAATKGPVTLWNRNKSHFQVRKVVVMDQFGARFGRSQSVANGKSKLQGMRTKYDNYPILGSLVRKAAKRQHNQTAGLVRNIFVNRVEQQARQRVDQQIETELASARRQFETKVFDPLRRMELNPRAMQMQTRADGRVVVRGRLAADHQLAAFTARPQAYRGSLLTMQIHESAMNNFLQQLKLDGREANLKELYTELAQQLDLAPPSEPVEIPENVTIKFAEKAAVRVIIDDGKVCLKLRIKSLKPDGERGWSNFEVSANYFPYREENSGMGFYFSRGEGISLSKKSRSGGIALRAIFTKVLSPNRKIHLVNPGLVQDERFARLNVTQMEIHNGWIGLSVGQGAPSPIVAVRESRGQTR